MTSPHSARKASATVRQAGGSTIHDAPAPSVQPTNASTATIASAATFHATAVASEPKRWPVRRSSSAQNEVVKPAIARCEWATRPWVNFSRSSTPGRKAMKPVTTSRPHHSIDATRQPCGRSGHTKPRQSRHSSHGHGSSSASAPICKASAWLPPMPSAMPQTTHDTTRKTTIPRPPRPAFRASPQARGSIINKATTTSVEPSRLAPVGPPVPRSIGG